MPFYAVIQPGFAIYGTGATPRATLDDARQRMDNSETLTDDLTGLNQAVDGDPVLLLCSEALYAAVRKRGGDVPFMIDDDGGMAMLEGEKGSHP